MSERAPILILAFGFDGAEMRGDKIAGSSKSGASEPIVLKTWVRAEPPIRAFPTPMSRSKSVEAFLLECNSGVHVLETSRTGANAVTIRDKGEEKRKKKNL